MPFPARFNRFQKASANFFRFFEDSVWARRHLEPNMADFVFGNPHDPPMPEFVNALVRHAEPRTNDWFAYKNNEEPARKVVARSLAASHSMPFESSDVFLTTGVFAGLAVALAALTEPGDEVIFPSPPWFFYEAMIAWQGAVPVPVPVRKDDFDLDLEALAAAITPRTRAVIVNSPHNPTGRIYSDATLESLASLLNEHGNRYGRPIYLLSDEAYRRIVFDGRSCPSPTKYYEHTLLLYTYGKTLLTPGQRLGYIALPPTMPDRAAHREVLFAAQLMTGWAFPNALLQHALDDIDRLKIDVDRLQARRDKLVSALRGMGYELHNPQGTFYLLPRSPIPDDWRFSELLGSLGVLCLPGVVSEVPGYFRLSLTANDTMIAQALPLFEQALAIARQ